MSTERFLPVGVGLFLFSVVFVLYAGAMDAEFVNFDDTFYGTENPIVAAGITNPDSFVYAWTTLDYGNWTPLTWLSLELDATLFGLAPRAFHRTNVLLHALNSVLLFVALRRMTRTIGCSAIVAFFFAIHPMHVESVAWVSERRDVLCTTFLMLAMIAYERYAANPTWGRWTFVALAMVMGLLSKSMLVTLPVLLLLFDWWPLNRMTGTAWNFFFPKQNRWNKSRFEEAPDLWVMSTLTELPQDHAAPITLLHYSQRSVIALVIEKLPLFALSLIVGVITIIAQKNANCVVPLDFVPLPLRIGNALQSYGWYLWKTFVPTNLCILYAHPGRDLEWKSVVLAAIVLVMMTIFVSRNSTRHGHRLFGWAWFVISLLPVIGLLQVGTQSHADRYVYIPHIGLFVLIVWETHLWLIRRQIDSRWGIAVAAVISVFWSIRTVEQIVVWHNSESLWQQALRVDPQNDRAHLNFGIALYDQGKFDDAEPYFQRSLRQGDNHIAIHNLGLIHEQRKDWESATEHYQWALRIRPNFLPSTERLAALTRQNPAIESSKAHPRQTSPAHIAMQQGMLAARRGDMTGALSQFQVAIENEPGNADAHNNAALALAELKRPREAEKAQRQAVQLAPENADFHVNLAVLLESNGNPTEAIEHYRETIRLRPKDAEAKRRLQNIERQLNRP